MTHPHDGLDWFSAIGPTLAAFFAAWVAWSTYKRGERLQRQLTRPQVMFRHNFQLGDQSLRWIVELRNEGPTAANIEEFTVLACGEEVPAGFFSTPNQYWRTLFERIGAQKILNISSPVTIRVPFGLGSNSSVPLFDTTLGGDSKSLEEIVSRLELRIAFHSPDGELYRVASKRTGLAGEQLPLMTRQKGLPRVLAWFAAGAPHRRWHLSALVFESAGAVLIFMEARRMDITFGYINASYDPHMSPPGYAGWLYHAGAWGFACLLAGIILLGAALAFERRLED